MIVNSVSQYVSKEDLFFDVDTISPRYLIISDIIPENYSRVIDLLGLIAYSFRNKFLIEFIKHVLRETVNNSLNISLTYYTPEEICGFLTDRNYQTNIIDNLSPSELRYTVVAWK